MKITKCIIPAAGFGTRFLPATKAMPKEMLTIVDKPVIQMLVEEAVSAGITDIIIVSHRAKKAMEDHFDTSYELEKILEEKGKTKELGLVQEISKKAKFYFVRQPAPKGDGDAILRAKEIIGDEPCLVLFGDDLIKGEKSGASQLVEAFEKYKTPIIALEKVSDEKVSSYGIVEGENIDTKTCKISRFLEKPKATETDSRRGVIGKYIITPEIFTALESGEATASKDGEIRLADAFAKLLSEGKNLHGIEIEGVRYDTGDKLGYLKASVDYALDREDLGEDFKKFLAKKFAK